MQFALLYSYDPAQSRPTEGEVSDWNVIAGVWVIDVADTAAAVDWAQRIPTATYGKVEVRPIVEYPS